ncbi:MAG: peptidoglycan DD-metalloendopeptidase family protein [Gammaproteobacteria bacterium]|nr:peptidase M23 [Gammaproteobacteria bacterium]
MGRLKRSAVLLQASLAAFLLVGAPAAAQRDEQAELEDVRRRIGELERRLERQNAERGETAAALRRVELEIGAARQALEAIEAKADDARRRAAELETERAAIDRRLSAEKSLLAEQLRVAYMNGRAELLKLLLSQESPADFGRMMVYYGYFSRARGAQLRAVAEDLDEARRVAAEAEAVAAELDALSTRRAAELAALERSRSERQALLAELETSIAAAGGELERLRDEERRLIELVTELGNLLAGFPADSEEPFDRLKGRLAWPVAGEIAADYGKERAGGLRWNGVLLSAPAGAPVRAVYHGRVAFADWLQGLGLLIVLDHGDGYMSLYGHNDALLKEPGDWVRPGEPIAEVGTTGGRREPALYFEIRHRGQPVNPHAWIAK